MTDQLPGKDVSLWIDTTPATDFSALAESGEYDTVVIGGGITGLLTAWYLSEAGQRVAIIETARIVLGTTGGTTAKLTSQHGLIYRVLLNKHGREAARIYGEANQTAIDDVERLASDLGIACDFSRRDAYVYSEAESEVEEMKAEAEAAADLGLPADFTTSTDLPFPVAGAVRFRNQAQFHPRKFLLGIAARLIENKVPIFEQTQMTDLQVEESGGVTVETSRGSLHARYVVQATKEPMWRPELFKDLLSKKQSYNYGLKIGGHYPQGMYITTGRPTRSIRSHPYNDGQILVLNGESHPSDDGSSMDEHFKNLYEFAKSRFEVKEVIYRWMASDTVPKDQMPYIGAYPSQRDVYIVTGLKAWGLAFAMAAAHIVSDDILGRPNAWAATFSLDRSIRS